MRIAIAGVARAALRGSARDDLVIGDPLTGGCIQNGVYDRHQAPIRLLGGEDRLRTVTTPASRRPNGLLAYSTIDTGAGADRLLGAASQAGIVLCETFLTTRSGHDRITGVGDSTAISTGALSTGSGRDRIHASQGRSITMPRIGLSISLGLVDTGHGADRVRAWGTEAGLAQGDGGLNTADGNDVVDVRHGGVSSDAFNAVRLGPGHDRFIGFAAAGAGMVAVQADTGHDTLVLPAGTYRISGPLVQAAGASLRAEGFERLAGIGGGRLPFADGTVVVDAGGIRRG